MGVWVYENSSDASRNNFEASLFKEFVELKLIHRNRETSFELQPD